MKFRSLLIAPVILLVRLYQIVTASLLPHVCRHEPTCSQYALESLKQFGLIKGFWQAIKRISRCHPWGTFGYDPVVLDGEQNKK